MFTKNQSDLAEDYLVVDPGDLARYSETFASTYADIVAACPVSQLLLAINHSDCIGKSKLLSIPLPKAIPRDSGKTIIARTIALATIDGAEEAVLGYLEGSGYQVAAWSQGGKVVYHITNEDLPPW